MKYNLDTNENVKIKCSIILAGIIQFHAEKHF